VADISEKARQSSHLLDDVRCEGLSRDHGRPRHHRIRGLSQRVVFRVHAVQRMFERGISAADVCHVLSRGAIIEEYPTDEPYPSRLVLGWCQSRPIHVVVADNKPDDELIVITVYEPDPALWEELRRRKE
jgi:hypothetical protein